MRHFFQCFSSSSGSEERTANEGRLWPISLTLELQVLTFSGWDQLEINIGFHAKKTQGLQSFPVNSVFFGPLSSYWEKCYAGTSALGLLETKLFLVFPGYHFN